MDPRTIGSSTLTSGICVFLGLVFVVAGGLKLARVPVMVESFIEWGYSVPLMLAVGVLEIAGAVMIVSRRARLAGAGLLFALMLAAALTHVRAGEWAMLPAPLVMLALAALVAWAEYRSRGPRESHA